MRRQIRRIEKADIGAVNARQEAVRLKLKGLEIKGVTSGPQVEALNAQLGPLQEQYQALAARLTDLRKAQSITVMVAGDGGKEKDIPLSQVVSVKFPNSMGLVAKTVDYMSGVWNFIADDPREANTEGGVFPAIFGTVLMVLIMSIVVTPSACSRLLSSGVRHAGAFVSAVRIAVNKWPACRPSFRRVRVGFFIYFVGGSIDRIFYPEALPTPTFGTGGILWASLTLALLTVPVVIVATEEGLAAIPGGMREASLALSATKLETTLRVVLPAVMPSILTGLSWQARARARSPRS